MASTLQVSGSVNGEFTCKWTIEEFNCLDFHVGTCYKSKTFRLEESGKDLCLALYPGGKTERERGNVSCFVYGVNYEQLLKWKYDLLFIKSNGKELFVGETEKLADHKEEAWGHLVTVGSENLIYETARDYVLVVILRATYCATDVQGVIGTCRHAETIHLEHLSNDWRKLWTSKRNTDCNIEIGDKLIPAHSLVLTTRSEVFAAMFKHETVEKLSGLVKVTDVTEDTMMLLLEFIYTGEFIQMSFERALALFKASDKYQVNDLKSYCGSHLMALINGDNARRIRDTADMHAAGGLRSYASKYLDENRPEDDSEAQRA